MKRNCASTNPLRRRAVLTASAILAGGAVARAAFAADRLDAADPVSVLRATVKMRGALDQRLVFGALKATRYSVVNAEVRPLMGLVTGTFSRYAIGPDGAVTVRSMELAFYTDPASGALLETLTMPYTGTTVEVPRLRLGPSTGVIKPQWQYVEERTAAAPASRSQQAMSAAGTSRTVHYLRPPVIRDGVITIQQDSFGRIQPAAAGAAVIGYNEMVTASAPLAEVEDPALLTAASRLGFTDVSTWRPWMKMDGVPGHTVSHGVGGKAFRVEDLPKDYVAFAERFYPDVIHDPEKTLAGG